MKTKKRSLTRYLGIRTALDDSRAKAVLKALREQPGVEEVELTKNRMRLRYDPLQTRMDHLQALLEERSVELSRSWIHSCRLAWYQYQDEAVCENAGAPPPACCNRPPRPR